MPSHWEIVNGSVVEFNTALHSKSYYGLENNADRRRFIEAAISLACAVSGVPREDVPTPFKVSDVEELIFVKSF